jgi:threonylcarbamoyladenosine tRNA methylthiotransferase CDKAL1
VRVYVESFGCAQNQGEGAAIARELVENGHELLTDARGADAGVLVTCGVIGPTESRMVRRWRELSRRVPRVIVTGCLVPLRTPLFDGPGRERTRFVPIREQDRIPALLAGAPAPSVAHALPPPVAPLLGLSAGPPVSEEVVIAQGCTSGCSYCFSRLARGPIESVPASEVVRRVRQAVARGAAEVRLTSLDTAAWGHDRPDGQRLPDLLREVAKIPGDFRVRIGMMSPQTLGPILPEYLGAFGHDRFYRFLHLPVQSGSDRVLAAMHRGYTAGEFFDQVGAVRAQYPDLMLSTDVIVGFPGESEDEHRATERLVDRLAPETLNVTRFSPRPGTPAAHLPPLAPGVAKRRSRSLAKLRERVARARLERWIGCTTRARVLEHGPGQSAVVRLPNYLPLVLDEQPDLGTEREVRVDGARSTYLLGHVIDAGL